MQEYLKEHSFDLKALKKIYRDFFPDPYTRMRNVIKRNILESLKNKDSVFFVQVGSNDGMQGDPLHDLIIRNSNWKGIFIEPVSFLFDRLKLNYGNSDRFIFEKQAIAPIRSTAEFFYVSQRAKAELGEALPYWYDQLGSFDRNHILKHLDGMLEPYIISEEIDAVPLQEIFDKHQVKRVDLLHIDTEGYDYKVLSTIDFSVYQPGVILYENAHLSTIEKESAESLLKSHGYTCTYYDGDTLATISG